MDDQAKELELETLELIVSDTGAEPIQLSYALMSHITDKFSNEIGRGGFGVVYKGVLRNADVAVKKLSNPHTLSEQQFLDEIICLKKAKHKNIVRFIGYCSETQGELLEYNGANIMAEVLNKLLCFEYVPGGNIEHYLKQEKPYGDGWKLRYQMIRGICQGLHYLHDQKINHLDLKPENVMLDAHMDPKITDFGLSRCLDHGQSKLITQNILGTRRYIAPEVIDKGEISFKADIYALGIIIIELLTGISRKPLENWDESLDMDCPRVRKCVEIARNCTEHDRHSRPTVLEVISDLDDLESMIPNSPLYQVTDLVDVYPLQLTFPFKKDSITECFVSLTNKHTDRGLYIVITPEVPDEYWCKHPQVFLSPMNTSVVKVYRREETEPTSHTGKLEVLIFTTVLDHKTFRQQTSAYSGSLEDFRKDAHELFGCELYRVALTTVVVVSENDNKSSFELTHVPRQDEDEEMYFVHKIFDVHPTEPWVLADLLYADGTVIFNWETKKILGTLGTAYKSAKFIARKQWVAVGYAVGHISVYACPAMDGLSTIKAHNDSVSLLEVHPTRPLLLSCSTLSMKIWDWNRGWSCTGVFDIANDVSRAMFNPKHTNTFATLRSCGIVEMWKFGHPDPVVELKLSKRTKFFIHSGNQHFLAAFHDKDLIKILDLPNKKLVHGITIVADYLPSIVSVVCHEACPIFVTASRNGEIRVWDSNTWRLKKTYKSLPPKPIHLGFTGSKRLVIGYEDRIIVMDIDLE